MAFSYQQMRTKKGYSMAEVTSAMQKEIRRGNEFEAGFWARELVTSGFAQHMWKRLVICASEDVADIQVTLLVNALYQSYFAIEKSSKTTLHWTLVSHAVLALSRAPKNREADNYGYYVLMRHETERLEIPDYALDMHTQRGKSMGRDIGDFWDMLVLKPEVGEDIYKDDVVRMSVEGVTSTDAADQEALPI